MTKIKVEGTVDRAVFDEFRRICLLEFEHAEAEDKVQPNVSHVLEMLLRKGIKTYKTEKRQHCVVAELSDVDADH